MYKQLTSEQRYAISVLLQQKKSKKDIAEAIGVCKSTVYREIKRNKQKRGGYNAAFAQQLARERKERMPGNRAVDISVKNQALHLLRTEQWSPQQISGYLARNGISISHETIYQIIRKDKQLGGNFYKNCRHRLKHRRRPVGSSIKIPNRTSIHQRPPQADGTRFGDMEMDTIIQNDGVILTLTERKTNFIMLKKLKHGKNAQQLAESVVQILFPFRKNLKTITTDNGTEFAAHQLITKKLGVNVYFADPYSSWQKGSIENANKLIRQYIPKNARVSDFSDKQIADIQYKLNRRPRKKLNFNSPKNIFFNFLS